MSERTAYSEQDGKVHGFVVEQTIYGYGVREFVRAPWQGSPWSQLTFHDGFGSRADANGFVDSRMEEE